MKSTYRYLRIHLSRILIYSILPSLGLLIFGLIFIGQYIAYVFAALVVVSIVQIVTAYGTINVEQAKGKYTLHFIDSTNNLTLIPPISYKSYWFYSFTSGTHFTVAHPGKQGATSNHINVVLELKDREGNCVYLHELIVLDSRFPHEAVYITKPPKKNCTLIIVQRTDKVLQFLKTVLPEDLLIQGDAT